jgi:cation diffusion facilitator family transporter
MQEKVEISTKKLLLLSIMLIAITGTLVGIGTYAYFSATAVSGPNNFFTGSISIWAQAVDSSLDIFAVVITFLTVGYSSQPADQEHPFGHGKVEDVAAGIQAVLLFGASISVAYAAIQRIISGTRIELPGAGVGVMLISMRKADAIFSLPILSVKGLNLP